MKRIFTFLTGLLLWAAFASAQQPPNPSFELWSMHRTWGFLPTTWYGTNYPSYDYTGVFSRSTNPVHGTKYVELIAGQKSALGETYKIPGGLTLSDLYYATGASQFKEGKPKAGVPYAHRPTRLTGSYKYTSVQGDSYYMSVSLTRWNRATLKRETIGFGEKTSAQSTADWTYFEIPIQYSSSLTPDTLNIIFLTSPVFSAADLAKVKVGSTLAIDNLNFIMTDYFDVDFNYTGNPCTGSTLTFNATSQNLPGDSWEWKINGNVAGNSATLSYTFPEVTVETNFTVTLKGTNNAIGTDEITKTITIHPKPEIGIQLESTIICPGSTITITATGGASYSWNTGDRTETITTKPKSHQFYEVTGTDYYGCTNKASEIIIYHKLDTTNASAEFCANGTYQFFDRELTEPGVYYHSIPSKLTGCDSTIRLTLTTIPAPVATLTAGSTSLCPGSSTNLTATPGLTGYDWGNGFVSENTKIITPEKDSTYSVIVKSENGCTLNLSVDITVSPTLFSEDTFELCEGDSVLVFEDWVKEAGLFTKTFTSQAGCDSTVSILVNVNPFPAVFNALGTGGYAPGTEGREISLSSSETGVSYHLSLNGEILKTIEGTGAALAFGPYLAGKYLIEAENNTTGCLVMMPDTVIITVNVGIDNLSQNERYYIYPNPAREVIYLNAPLKGELRIYDNSGRIVARQLDLGRQSINIQQLAPGVYIVELKADDFSEFIKLIKL